MKRKKLKLRNWVKVTLTGIIIIIISVTLTIGFLKGISKDSEKQQIKQEKINELIRIQEMRK